jgi:hypothetical protein
VKKKLKILNFERLTLAENLGLKSFPNISIFKGDFRTKFHFNSTIDKKSVLKFLKDYENKKLNKFQKSKKRPVNDRDVMYPSLVEVVSDSFHELVVKSNCDVLLLVYADWSESSMYLVSLLSIISEVFKEMNYSSLIISKMDFDENDLNDNFSVDEKIPILKYFKNNEKSKPNTYQLESSVEDLFKFIDLNST